MHKHLLSISIILFLLSSNLLAQNSVKPWMGVHIEESKTQGVLIQKSVQGTPAFKAGLKSGDIVLRVDKTEVNSPKALIKAVTSKGVGHKVEITFLRNNKKQSATLKLEAMPGMLELAKRNLLNRPLPDLKFDNINPSGKKDFKISKDKPKIIEFWATWCGACLQAHPIINKFMQKNNDKIQFISVSTERTIKIKKFLKRKSTEIQKDIIYINDEKSELDDTFFVPALPMFFVVDKNNSIKHITIGTGENLDEVFKIALNLSEEK